MNDLAKEIAKTESLSKEKRRLLWTELGKSLLVCILPEQWWLAASSQLSLFVDFSLCTARHVIVEQNCPQEATLLLRECPLLKLEDLLSCFHEFVTIDEFKVRPVYVFSKS